MKMTLVPAVDFDPDFASPAEWAAMYRACGLQIIPGYMPGESGSSSWKRPRLAEWAEFQQAIAPQAVFDRWYGEGGEHVNRQNIGIITGRCSGNVFVIDLDDQKGPAAEAWWQGVIEVNNNGIDPETVQQHTGGGGRQKLFRAPPDWHAPTNRTSLGVDIRGQVGFAVMPASLHESGKYYAWDAGHAPWEIPIADAPEWLLEEIERLVEAHGGDSSGPRARTPGGSDYDAFGHQTDGRETYMRDLVWASVVDWYRECPIGPPSAAECAVRMAALWDTYERNTRSRLPADGSSNAELLEREGRGYSLFANKWRRAIRKWHSKIAEEAGRPRPALIPDGYSPASQPAPSAPSAESAPSAPPIPVLDAFPIDPSTVPPRDWAVPGLMLRRNVTVLVAPPGSGKSLLTLQWGIMMGSGIAWGGWVPRKAEKVLIVNTEDDYDEMRRRLYMAAQQMGVDQASLAGRVMLADAPENIVIAKFDARTKSVLRTPLVEDLVRTVNLLGIGVLIVDPFAETFEGDENSNSEVKWAGILWREVARRTGCVVILVHHTRKFATADAGADSSRGGGALIGTARILGTLFNMTDDEASAFGIPADSRGDFVRYDDAKANHNKKALVRWFEKKSVVFPNGTGFVAPDEVGVLSPWKPPGPLEGVSMHTIGLILDIIGRGVMAHDGQPTGQLFGPTAVSRERWAGTVVVNLIGCDEDRAKAIIKAWLKSGVLEVTEYDDAVQRKVRTGVLVNAEKRPDSGAIYG